MSVSESARGQGVGAGIAIAGLAVGVGGGLSLYGKGTAQALAGDKAESLAEGLAWDKKFRAADTPEKLAAFRLEQMNRDAALLSDDPKVVAARLADDSPKHTAGLATRRLGVGAMVVGAALLGAGLITIAANRPSA
jgi:hypothetical protein